MLDDAMKRSHRKELKHIFSSVVGVAVAVLNPVIVGWDNIYFCWWLQSDSHSECMRMHLKLCNSNWETDMERKTHQNFECSLLLKDRNFCIKCRMHLCCCAWLIWNSLNKRLLVLFIFQSQYRRAKGLIQMAYSPKKQHYEKYCYEKI